MNNIKNLHGFKLIKKEHFDEINGEFYLLEHIKTGAKLIFLENDDNNRVFMIGFKTPSNNSTGVAHILEHSTLCGSEKYPVKEPFVELLKGSLNTFLNAMTYPDKTVYPVASTNKKDFRNLTDVYLDAVFNPNIYQNPYTFMQEGWHYHIENPESPIDYNGVVYNEMKGVYSDPNAVMERGILETLYPDTIYSQESGGDPNDIPNLTYEEFLAFHSKYYHPSNAFIYVYGDNDLEEQLEYLNSWLDKYDKKDIDSSIKIQPAFEKLAEKEINYAINPDSEVKNKDMISLNYSFREDLTPEEIKALNILIDYLLDNNASILKKHLLDKKLAGDISVLFETSLNQPFLSIILKDTDKSKKDEFLQTVNETLNELITNGLNQDDLEAVINSNEFRALEQLNGSSSYYPKGLLIGLIIFDSWLYGKNPFDALNIFNQYKKINELKDNGYFESLIKEFLIDNNHKSVVTLIPDKELLQKQQEALNKKLKDFKESLSPEEIDHLVKETNELIKNQNKVDSIEDLNKIPRLHVDEIDKEVKEINYEVIEENGYPVIYVNNKNGEIVYLTLNFNFLPIKQEDLQYLKLFEELLAEVSTKNYDYQKLSKEFDKFTGGINTSLVINKNLENNELIPLLVLSIATKEENISKTIGLLNEVINNSIFTEKNIIKDVIQSIRIQKKTLIQNQGNLIASLRMQASFSDSARILEEVDGLSFYNFIVDLDENFDREWESLSQKLKELAETVFNINGFIVGIACSENIKPTVLKEVNELTKTFSKDELELNKYEFKQIPKTEAFLTAGNVMYNAKGGYYPIKDVNIGSLRVLKTLLSMDYLWNKVRVLGGAYGVNFNFNRLGEFSFSSFRDPNLDKTYKNFDESINYLKDLDLTQDDINKYIIGTISNLDMPLSTKQELSVALDMYLSGLTNRERQEERNQILNTNLDDIQQNIGIINDVITQGNYVTVGIDEVVKNSNTRFEEIEFVK